MATLSTELPSVERVFRRMVAHTLFVVAVYGVWLLGSASAVCLASGSWVIAQELARDIAALVLLPIVTMARDWRNPGFGWAALIPVAACMLFELARHPCLLRTFGL